MKSWLLEPKSNERNCEAPYHLLCGKWREKAVRKRRRNRWRWIGWWYKSLPFMRMASIVVVGDGKPRGMRESEEIDRESEGDEGIWFWWEMKGNGFDEEGISVIGWRAILVFNNLNTRPLTPHIIMWPQIFLNCFFFFPFYILAKHL